jgi:hypothetical protein
MHSNSCFLLSPVEPSLQAKRSQSIHFKIPFSFQMTANQINHHRTNTSRYTFTNNHQQSPNILRHISTPSLELFHNHHPINLTRSSFEHHHIRKKQPRTNPNYVNIQIKTTDGTLRSTYIRLDDMKKCQTLAFSSSSSPSSSEQNSILSPSQDYPSNETLRTDKTNEMMVNSNMMKQFITCTDGKEEQNPPSPRDIDLLF